jgi:bacillithiol system protein YtxJ
MIRECKSENDFAALLEESRQKPVFLLKHSTRCSTSRVALADFQRMQGDGTEAGFWQVMVLEHSDLSDKIAEATGIIHESPQAILFHQGKAIWNVSHLYVDIETMQEALSTIER